MARGRMISKSLSTSEKFAALVGVAGELAEFCQALYPLIVTHSDDFGRLQGDTFTVKMMCFPASPRSADEFSVGLAHLHTVGLIARYEVAGKRYIQIENFDPHQLGLHKRTRSAFPRVPGISGNDAEFDVKPTELPGQGKGTKGKGTEPKGTEHKINTALDSAFDTFWAAYPFKFGKDAARRAWAKRKPDAALAASILKALVEQRSWLRRDGGRFKLHASTWLNEGRWQDEIMTSETRGDGVTGGSNCPHDPRCATTTACIALTLGRKAS